MEKLLKASEYPAEIARVEAAIKKSKSSHLKKEFTKYLNRLRRELAEYQRFQGKAQ